MLAVIKLRAPKIKDVGVVETADLLAVVKLVTDKNGGSSLNRFLGSDFEHEAIVVVMPVGASLHAREMY